MRVKTTLKAGKVLTDIVASTSQALGLDNLSAKYTQKTGNDCGCDKRKRIMDSILPV